MTAKSMFTGKDNSIFNSNSENRLPLFLFNNYGQWSMVMAMTDTGSHRDRSDEHGCSLREGVP